RGNNAHARCRDCRVVTAGRYRPSFTSRLLIGPPILLCPAAMALGTLCGSRRIVRTIGSRITHLTLMQGWCDETGGAAIWKPPKTSQFLRFVIRSIRSALGGGDARSGGIFRC